MPYFFSVPTALTLIVFAHPVAASPAMPADMLYLRNLDSSIVQDIRYATAHNFTGSPLAGYNAAECVLSAKAAQALMRVQNTLVKQCYGLKVFDCYRPSRAVAHMIRFVSQPGDQAKTEFYPRVNKPDLWRLGYIAKVSNHSRGSTVDLTLTGPQALPAQAWSKNTLAVDCAAAYGQRLPDGGLYMGTSFDCFDELAHTNSPHISQTARQNRQRLTDAMNKEGFSGYKGEWWHFTYSRNLLQVEPMDFPIESLP